MAPEGGMKKKKKSVAKSFITRRFPRVYLVSRTSAYQHRDNICHARGGKFVRPQLQQVPMDSRAVVRSCENTQWGTVSNEYGIARRQLDKATTPLRVPSLSGALGKKLYGCGSRARGCPRLRQGTTGLHPQGWPSKCHALQ